MQGIRWELMFSPSKGRWFQVNIFQSRARARLFKKKLKDANPKLRYQIFRMPRTPRRARPSITNDSATWLRSYISNVSNVIAI